MEIFNISNLGQIKKDNKRRVAALGFFDGVHKAHKKIITEMLKETDIIPIVITLDKSPKEYFGHTSVECLTPLEKKSEIFEALGVQEVYYLSFNKQLQTLSAESYIDKVLKQLNVEKIFCGYDYKFGYKGAGTPKLMVDYGDIEVNILEEEMIGDRKISTTVLREFVESANFTGYYDFTGRYYSISGVVVKGRQLGRTINFPTANLKMESSYLLPKTNGVYITKTKVRDKIYKSITNIGYNPTVSEVKDKKFIETHILDFDAEIYGEMIEVYFYDFLRKEQKFESFNHLKKQLQKDKMVCEQKEI
ncbi:MULTISPECIES: bifunctional riboflavin kinase/FAD synthetase [Gemella]|uniref:bifunctional riboflavin kinase/FAD synthetase n=1 Tax=Gemella TaxID=1378 RepID=UPI0007682B5D|nr:MULTISPECIES: bifunctional riboflavin kinase/FAD synthetase [Gemella]AME09269.1 bifunctional riboflavin kinase/FMN adenylyltransferase [Gemella sp. oral taxon 928]AXI26902.1 bifunctional riboflavin kinase/FAD synthetase [Gemella sp. ND 6198]